MNDPTTQTMLTLSGLAYRGFADVTPGTQAKTLARDVIEGLSSLTPIRGQWDLAWGPVTHGVPGAFDSSAMYVVRSRSEPHRLVVAIRGTNPISVPDWLFGDLWVKTMVPWPYDPPGASISASTALGLQTLQAMKAHGPVASTPSTSRRSSGALTRALDGIDRHLFPALQKWTVDFVRPHDPLPSVRLRPSISSGAGPDTDLLTFLARQHTALPLDVVVTGHSKGGALAPAVALWLEEAKRSGRADERWDGGRGASVSCYAFAGPTPGNRPFADRVRTMLDARFHHVRNMDDLVTHAWQDDELRSIPAIFGSSKSAIVIGLLHLLIPAIAAPLVQLKLDYCQTAGPNVTQFDGGVSPDRTLAVEFVHQHLEAYLEHTGLTAMGITPLDFFWP